MTLQSLESLTLPAVTQLTADKAQGGYAVLANGQGVLLHIENTKQIGLYITVLPQPFVGTKIDKSALLSISQQINATEGYNGAVVYCPSECVK